MSSEHLERLRHLSPAKRAALLEAVRRKAPASASARVARREGSAPAPLSFSQRRLWFLSRLEPDNAAYNMRAAVRIAGRLDVAALRRSLDEIVRRHESLRTRFVMDGDEPVQIVADAHPVDLTIVDLTALPAAERDAEARHRARQETSRRFDLETGPPFRALLLRLGRDEHVALLTMHHIVADAWSGGVLFRELGALYEAFSAGERSPLAPLPVQYADFAQWQRDTLSDEALSEPLAYWRSRLAADTPPLDLPADRPRPARRSGDGERHRFRFDADLTRRIRALGEHHGATLFMTLLTAFDVLLHRYTGRTDLAVGTPVAGREREELEGLIGCFVNTVVLATDLSGDPSFADALARVRESALDAFTHRNVPFERIVDALRPRRDTGFHPLFQVMLVLQNASSEAMRLPGLTVTSYDADTGASPFDLTLYATEGPAELELWLQYSTDLFDEPTIARLAGHLEVLLRGAVDDPSCAVSALPLLTPAERAEQIPGARAASAPAAEVLIHDLFEAQAAATPNAIAVVVGGSELTYGALDRRASRLARRLRALGVGPEAAVGLFMERSVEALVGLMAILKAGGAYVPLDPTYPRDRVRFMLEDSGARVVLTQAARAAEVPAGTAAVVCVPPDDDGAGDSIADDTAHERAPSDGAAYVIYTSGSTGRPKGVVVSHRNLVHSTRARLAYYREPVTAYLLLPSFAFDSSVAGIFWTLSTGGTLVLPDEASRRDPERLAQLIEERRISHFLGLPSLYDRVLEAGGDRLSSLRAAIVAGETCPRTLVERHARVLPAVPLFNEYGPTEGTVWCTVHECRPTDVRADVPIGSAIADTAVYVLDRRLQLVPAGVAGELYLGGPGVARGYLGRPDLTAARFVPDPFGAPGGRLYHTGDAVRRRADGCVDFLGRLDHQVKIRGFRIELGEIEAALSALTSVRAGAVLARELGPEDRRLVAYVVPAAGQAMDPAALAAALRERLPEHMVPSLFVALEALPATPNGKLDRSALPGVDAAVGTTAPAARVAPRNPAEEILVRIFEELLRREAIGIHDGFFDLGGHSLLATQVVSRVRRAFGVELPLAALFETPTVAGIAARVEGLLQQGPAREEPALVRVSGNGERPLSFAQQRLWFAAQLDPENVAFNVRNALRLVGPLDTEALRRAFEEIVRRHEVLRTTFASVDGRPQAITGTVPTFDLPLVDLSGRTADERTNEVQRRARTASATPFDLARGPLMRATLLRLESREHVLLLGMHHIVSDAWSMGVLVRELGALYGAFVDGAPSPLADLPVQYGDFASWQQRYLQGETSERLLAYWKRTLAPPLPVLDLAGDRGRPATPSSRGACYTHDLPAGLADALRGLGRGQGVTLFMVLLAAFKVLLQRRTQTEDVVVGTDVAGRNRVETEGLIGFFINHLVLRTDLGGDPTFLELLARIRAVTLGAYAHQDMPFDRLVGALRPERDLAQTPLFQILFVLQNAPATAFALRDLAVERIPSEIETSKFDLGLFLGEHDDGLTASWIYKTDLFDRATVASLAGQLEAVLHSAVAHPERRISALEMHSEQERSRQVMDQRREREARLERLGRGRRRAIDVGGSGLVRTSDLGQGATRPLVVEPSVQDVDLVEWARANAEFVEAELLRHGALLFRGFDVPTPQRFEQFAAALCPELFGEYGDLPREEMGGKIYGSTPYPADQGILFHNESSHLHRWPLRIWFYCVRAAEKGGETPIVDCRRIYERLDAGLRQRFAEKGLLYVRNYADGLDVSWERFFGTTDRSEVERSCREAGTDFEWKGENGLRTRRRAQAVATHPRSGETVFFNQIQLHHTSYLEAAVRSGLESLYREEDRPRHVYYGDGSAIEESVVQELLGLYRETAVAFPWRESDVLMLDNMLIAHARNPFVGPRKIVVAMGEMRGA